MIGCQLHSNAIGYQNVVNMFVGFPIRKHQSKFMNITVWEHCSFDFLIWQRTPLSLLNSCKLSFPIVWLKMSSMTTLALNCSNKMFIHYLGSLSSTCCNSLYKLPFTLSFLCSVGAWTFRTMIWHRWPLSIMYDILSLTNSTLLTADVILLCTRKPLLNSWLSFTFP
jgi:hypothetical protein